MKKIMSIIIFNLSFFSPAHSQNLCGGIRFDLEISAYWQPIFFIKHPAKPDQSLGFLIDTGAEYNAVDREYFSIPSYDKRGYVKFKDISVLDSNEMKFWVMDVYSKYGTGKLPGFIGMENFLDKVIDLEFFPGKEGVVISKKPCPYDSLIKAGFKPISQKGFFGKDHLKEKKESYSSNTPVAFIKIGEVLAPALIDTGYASDPGSKRFIKINDALFQKLIDNNVNMVEGRDLENFDCHGNSHLGSTWTYPGDFIYVSDENGGSIREYQSTEVIFLKIPQNECSYLEKYSKPEALLDASFIGSWGGVIIDGISGLVWVRGR